MSRPVVHRLGFTVLASGEEHHARPVANVVFVHGLRGHPSRTWEHPKPKRPHKKEEEKSGSSLFSRWRGRERSKSPVITEKEFRSDDAVVICWPRDLLPQEIPNARILTYGYDADVVGGLFKGASKNSITQHGRDLMLQLEREVNGEPIIFVAHSLGGILVKEGLHWSKSNLTPRYQALHRCTKHIVFLGVPHRGSPMANMGEILTHLANASLQDTNRHIVSTLEVDGEILDRIHTEFMKMMHTEDFTVHSFQEGRGVSSLKGFSGKVVDDFSSKLDHPLELVETIDGNHMQMVRFGDREDPGYRKVSSVIARNVTSLVQERSVRNHAATVAITNRPREVPVIPKEKRYFRIPHISNRYFFGRVKELEWLESQLKDPSMHDDQRRVVIWGCGGAGKTQLVSTYAFRNQTDFSAVFWVTASSEVTLKKTYADIARHLGLGTSSISMTDGNVQQNLINLVKDWFTDHQQGDWLLVIDNADNLEEVDVEAFIPPTNKGNVIITSRNRQAEGFGPAIELGEMDSVDAISLLLRRASIGQPTSTDQSLASDITKSLGYLALAVEHAGAYVQSGGGSLLEFKEQFETNRRIILEKSPAVSMHKDSVFETFTMSFEKVRGRNTTAARLLTFLGFLDNETILESFILSDHEGTKIFRTMVVSELHEFHAAVQELLSFSLIRVIIDGDVKSISLHPLVHYFSRARMTIEEQWRWSEIAVTWILRSTNAIKEYESYYPHLREQLQQVTSLKQLPEDLKRRRLVWCYLGWLLQQYQHLWQNQGAMDELDKYARMAMTVMEEDPNDRDSFSISCKIAVMGVRVQTVQFIECSDTFDEVLRRYVLKQMTTAAVAAWQNAHDTAAGSITATRPAVTGNIQCDDKVALDIADLAVSVRHQVLSNTLPERELSKEANDVVEQKGSIAKKDDVGSNLTDPKPRTRDTDINPAVSSTASITRSVNENASTSRPRPVIALEPSLSLSSNETTATENPPQALPSEISSPPSQPQYLSDIFLHTDPEIHIQYLKGCLKTLARIYTYDNRTAEADLLLKYSTLPLNSSQTSNQPPGTSHLLSKASLLAAQKDLNGLLNTYQEILDAEPSEDGLKPLEIMYCAIDYAILLNKQGKSGKAERVIKKRFYGSDKAEEARARELKVLYVWVRKSLARALGSQGRHEEEYAVLCETMRIAEKVFGRNSLSFLHAMFLLRGLYREHEEWRENVEVERYTKELGEIFANLYGAGTGKISKAGFQMGMLLWAQGALEETVFVFELFVTLATKQLGSDDSLTRKARRGGALAREEWATEKHAGPGADLLRFGTLLFFRKMDVLALLVENEIA